MKAYLVHGGRPWTADPKHDHYAAAARATKHVFKVFIQFYFSNSVKKKLFQCRSIFVD